MPSSVLNKAGLPIRSFCRACGEDFSGDTMFDKHRVGEHDLDWPADENGRRCLDVEEMEAKGWTLNESGRWYDPAEVERTRERLVALKAEQATEATG